MFKTQTSIFTKTAKPSKHVSRTLSSPPSLEDLDTRNRTGFFVGFNLFSISSTSVGRTQPTWGSLPFS